jgi:hypothetical protein
MQMNLRSLSVAMLGATVLSGAGAALAAAVPASVEITSITPVQTYNVGETATDQAYVLVTGVAAGKSVTGRFPQTGAWTAAPKQPPVDPKKPVELWKGSLDDGQFALVTVTLMQGKGDDAAKIKDFTGKLEAANKSIADLGKPTLGSADDLKKLAAEKVKADRAVISKIKDTFSREKNTDHYGAQFSVILWNNKGKVVKRLDPVGLTFGEHNGLDVKIYTKLKNSRNNVISKNEKGQWEMQQFEPTNDDSTEVRVKGLETEMIPQSAGNPLRHTTDYLVGLTAKAGGKALTWTVEDQQNNEDAIHVYWNYAD